MVPVSMTAHALVTCKDPIVNANLLSQANFVKRTCARITVFMGEVPPDIGTKTTISANAIAPLAPQDLVVKRTLVLPYAVPMEAVVSSLIHERFATAASSLQVYSAANPCLLALRTLARPTNVRTVVSAKLSNQPKSNSTIQNASAPSIELA